MAIEASGMTPLEFLVQTMRDTRIDLRTRLDAASHAAPFVHAKLSSTDVTVSREPEQSLEELQGKLRMYLSDNPALLIGLMEDSSELTINAGETSFPG